MASTMQDLRFLCEQMKAQQDKKDTLTEQLAEVNKELDSLRLRKIPDLMAELGVRNATFEGLGRVQLAEDLYANTREGQKEAGIQWLRDLGYADMITEDYNASSLKALFRRMIVDGSPIPDEVFNVTPFTRASLVKA